MTHMARGMAAAAPTGTRAGRPVLALTGALAALMTLLVGHSILTPAQAPIAPAPRLPQERATDWAAVPTLAQLAISRGIGAHEHSYWATHAGSAVSLQNHPQGLSARFGAGGAAVTSKGGTLQLQLAGLQAGSRAVRPTSRPVASENRVSYSGAELSEWFANGPMGLEQGFRIAHPLGGGAALAISLHVSGSLRPTLLAGGQGLALRDPGGRIALRYDRISASDATGRSLPVRLSLNGGQATLHVDAAGAAYPVTVDPLLEEGQLSSAGGGLGGAVAIEGSTIVVGAPFTVVEKVEQGAVFVFTKPEGGWANSSQGAELIASDGKEVNENNVYGNTLGAAVAISGETIVASAPRATAGGATGTPFAGKLYVFVRPAGGWVNSTETAQLSASDPSNPDYLGASVATDGQTIVAGEPDNSGVGTAGPGAIYVFSKPDAGTWKSALETAKLTGTEADALGTSVAVSGSVIFGGAPYSPVKGKEYAGAVYEYTKTEGKGWTGGTQTAVLTAGGPAYETLGTAVALEGSTLAVGAANNADAGSAPSSAYVFTKPAEGWKTTESAAARLTPSDPSSAEHFGNSISISGKTIAVSAQYGPGLEKGAVGAVYLYEEPAGGWVSTSSQTQKLAAANGGVYQAESVALSGSTLIEGAPYATQVGGSSVGAAYVFGPTGPGEEAKKTKEEKKEETFVKPGSETKLTYVSTAPPVVRETFIGFPLNVPPGQAIACSGNTCTYAVTCRKKGEPCIGSATFEEIAGAFASAAKTKRRRPAILGSASFDIAAGHSAKVKIKLSATGRRLLGRKHRLKAKLVIRVTGSSATKPISTRTVTIKLGRKH
jgi:hypothetical protein